MFYDLRMDFDAWFWTMLIAVGLAVAYLIGTLGHGNGLRGTSRLRNNSNLPKYTALSVDTSETKQQVINRVRVILIPLTVLIGIYIWLQFFSAAPDTTTLEQGVVLLGLTYFVPYAIGAKEAYDSAKYREEVGITRLQELGVAPDLYRRYRIVMFTDDKEHQQRHDYFLSSFLKNSPAFFKGVQDGDAVYLFDTALERNHDAMYSTVVVYRKATDKVIRAGMLQYESKMVEHHKAS